MMCSTSKNVCWFITLLMPILVVFTPFSACYGDEDYIASILDMPDDEVTIEEVIGEDVGPATLHLYLFDSTGAVLDFSEHPIPANFFGEGSVPFDDTIELEGVPMYFQDAYDLHHTDTIIGIHIPEELPSVSESLSVVSEMLKLSLQGVSPIKMFNLLDPALPSQEWSVSVHLSQLQHQPLATSTLTCTSDTGGTIDLSASAVFCLEFTDSEGNTLVYDMGDPQYWTYDEPLVLELSSAAPIPWRQGEYPEGLLHLPKLSGDICVGCSDDASEDSDWTWEGSGFTQSVVPAQMPPQHPPTGIDPAASVHESVYIAGAETIDQGAVIEKDVLIGPFVKVGENAHISQGAVLAKGCVVGEWARIGANTYIGEGTIISVDVSIGDDTSIQSDVSLGNGVQVGDNVYIGSQTSIGEVCHIGDAVFIEGSTSIRPETNVKEGVYIVEGVDWDRRSDINRDLLTCQLPSGDSQAVSVSVCNDMGGIVWGLLPVEPCYVAGHSWRRRNIKVPVRQLSSSEYQPLEDRIKALGIFRRRYIKDDYDCDDFASDLEIELEKDYNATFTVIYEVNPAQNCFNFLYTPRWHKGHALTDLHLWNAKEKKMKTIWIEPQRDPADDYLGVDLDGNKDRKVTYATSPVTYPTDGKYRIEVYQNRAAAEAAGVELDPPKKK